MKKYWLFAWDDWNPSSGMDDFRGAFFTAEEAKATLPKYFESHFGSRHRRDGGLLVIAAVAEVIEVTDDGPRKCWRYSVGQSTLEADCQETKWREVLSGD